MTERKGERVDDRLEAGYRGAKRFGKSQDGWRTVQTWGDITRKEESQPSTKRLIESQRNVWRRISFPVIHVDETTPHLHCDLVPLTMGNLSMKDVIGEMCKNARTQEKFLKAMQERVPRAKFVWSLEKAQNLTA